MKSARELVERLRAYQPPNTDLGQHFLIDDTMLERMVSIAEVNQGDHVLEIGPGPGTLTQHLLKAGANVTAIEIDDAPVLHLDEAFREEQNTKQLILHHDDALNASWPSNITKVVANIPYQISSNLLIEDGGPIILRRSFLLVLFILIFSYLASIDLNP